MVAGLERGRGALVLQRNLLGRSWDHMRSTRMPGEWPFSFRSICVDQQVVLWLRGLSRGNLWG